MASMCSRWSKRKASRAPASASCRPAPVQGTDIVVNDGLAEGELIAAAGSFKLREGLLVQTTNPPGRRQARSGQLSRGQPPCARWTSSSGGR